MAVGGLITGMVSTQGLAPLQPDCRRLFHFRNCQLSAPVAFRMTWVPLAYVALQAPLSPLPLLVQLIGGAGGGDRC